MLRNFHQFQGLSLSYSRPGHFGAIPSICNQRSMAYTVQTVNDRAAGLVSFWSSGCPIIDRWAASFVFNSAVHHMVHEFQFFYWWKDQRFVLMQKKLLSLKNGIGNWEFVNPYSGPSQGLKIRAGACSNVVGIMCPTG